jgi:hypothetical protein
MSISYQDWTEKLLVEAGDATKLLAIFKALTVARFLFPFPELSEQTLSPFDVQRLWRSWTRLGHPGAVALRCDQ